MLIERTESEVLSLAASAELSENSRPGFATKVNPQEPGLLSGNVQSTLGIHVSLRETRGGSRIQTWNRYAYVLNNPLSYTDPLGLDCSSGNINDFGSGGNAGYTISVNARGKCPPPLALSEMVMPVLIHFYTLRESDDIHGTGRCKGDPDCLARRKRPAGTDANKSNDILVENDLWHNSPQCQNCGNIWSNANQVTDPRTIALWYGGSAIEGLLLVPSAGAAVSSSIYDTWLGFEYAFPGATADTIQMLTPPSSIPSTIPGAVVFGGEQIYDWYRNHD